jgi:hypothetical protein
MMAKLAIAPPVAAKGKKGAATPAKAAAPAAKPAPSKKK